MDVNQDQLVIAIDGPAGSGKTTISQELALILRCECVNTGNMYRAIAILAGDLTNESAIVTMAENCQFEFVYDGRFRMMVNGRDLTDTVQSPGIVPLASKIARISQLRNVLTEKQRALARGKRVVMEGRDIGSHVLPNADWKIFIDADIEVRARRLYQELSSEDRMKYRSLEAFQQELEIVDRQDAERKNAPLKLSEQAIYHKTGCFTPREEAIVLYYYITAHVELQRNAKVAAHRESLLRRLERG